MANATVMRRDVLGYLVEWQQRADRKPLVIRGARQVGKTFLVQLFGERHFANVVYVNFEQRAELGELFASKSPQKILPLLELQTHSTVTPGRTLLFLDEVQAAPDVLPCLRYFYPGHRRRPGRSESRHHRAPALPAALHGGEVEHVGRPDKQRPPFRRRGADRELSHRAGELSTAVVALLAGRAGSAVGGCRTGALSTSACFAPRVPIQARERPSSSAASGRRATGCSWDGRSTILEVIGFPPLPTPEPTQCPPTSTVARSAKPCWRSSSVRTRCRGPSAVLTASPRAVPATASW
ncbi:MAG: hypothetical protein COY42_20510 [Armatimonadetes bacterium CG_4_10_14_0_8_um_filter_66_14]|nr:MAG: hypothetical protein COY42_20510 [Armatimonadetes bacterium CG_4_10_14_0_8_um_filter_66_14]